MNGRPVVSEAEVEALATALRSDPGLVGALWRLKRWTEVVLTALEIGFDGERVTIPERDDGGALTGLLRYAPEPLRQNGQPKSIADAGSIRQLFPQPDGEPVAWIVEGEPDAITARSAGCRRSQCRARPAGRPTTPSASATSTS